MSGLAEFHLYANAPSLWLYYALWTLLCVIWNAWLDEDCVRLDDSVVRLLRVLSPPTGAARDSTT